MPLVSMAPMLREGRRNGYGIAAYNMIDHNSARSIVDGAAELNTPVIVQVSVKTVKHWGPPAGGPVRAPAGQGDSVANLAGLDDGAPSLAVTTGR